MKNFVPKTKFLNQDIVNLAVGVKLNKLIKGDAFALLNYAIKDGESPDTVAYNYYDDPSYAWLVLLSNNIIDPYFEWPLLALVLSRHTDIFTMHASEG